MLCYNNLVETQSTVERGVIKNILPSQCSFYVVSLYFDINKNKNKYLPQLKNRYTCDILGSYLYINPTDQDNKKLFLSTDFKQARE